MDSSAGIRRLRKASPSAARRRRYKDLEISCQHVFAVVAICRHPQRESSVLSAAIAARTSVVIAPSMNTASPTRRSESASRFFVTQMIVGINVLVFAPWCFREFLRWRRPSSNW